jgi:hypothetical protein
MRVSFNQVVRPVMWLMVAMDTTVIPVLYCRVPGGYPATGYTPCKPRPPGICVYLPLVQTHYAFHIKLYMKNFFKKKYTPYGLNPGGGHASTSPIAQDRLVGDLHQVIPQ